MRADVNLSVRRVGDAELGTRTETKNMNSFKAIARAIEYEIFRQIELLEDGGQVLQETRRWDDERGVGYAMRSKENVHDYRYFPEPDLAPINISDEWLEEIRGTIPELPDQKQARYVADYKLSDYDPAQLKQRANRRLTIMYAAPAILQQRASSLGSVGEQVDNRDAGVAPNIDLGIGLNYLLHGHALLFGDVEDIPGVENNHVLMDAALPTPAALESELKIQIQQISLQLLNALASRHHFAKIHM